jgi:cytochrome c2
MIDASSSDTSAWAAARRYPSARMSLAASRAMRAACLTLPAFALVVAGVAHAAHVAGDAERGRRLLRDYGCGGCHRIPGVAGARGNVGPSLEAVAERVYLAGRVPNSPEGMARFILDPRAFQPRTAMPDVGASDDEARDMVAFLHRTR